jgi:hypothetical protein
MPFASFRVEIAPEAEADLQEIENYWTQRGEVWRGEKYYLDLAITAQRELGDAVSARRGRLMKTRSGREVREILAFGVLSNRIQHRRRGAPRESSPVLARPPG